MLDINNNCKIKFVNGETWIFIFKQFYYVNEDYFSSSGLLNILLGNQSIYSL